MVLGHGGGRLEETILRDLSYNALAWISLEIASAWIMLALLLLGILALALGESGLALGESGLALGEFRLAFSINFFNFWWQFQWIFSEFCHYFNGIFIDFQCAKLFEISLAFSSIFFGFSLDYISAAFGKYCIYILWAILGLD